MNCVVWVDDHARRGIYVTMVVPELVLSGACRVWPSCELYLTDRKYRLREGTTVTSDDHAQHDGHAHDHDPTFYRSPRDAAAGPPEKLAYVAAFAKPADKPDAIAVVDTDPASPSYATVVGFTELPYTGDELHHFGWNACSSALCPTGDHRPRRSQVPGRAGDQVIAGLHSRHQGRAYIAAGHQGARA